MIARIATVAVTTLAGADGVRVSIGVVNGRRMVRARLENGLARGR